MSYAAKGYGKLVGMEGFSETLRKNHFTLYQGYVTDTNKVPDALAAMPKEEKTGPSEYAERKKRLGREFNGMRQYEYYFENLGGKSALDEGSKQGNALAAEFGSVEKREPISVPRARYAGSAGWSSTRTPTESGSSTSGSMSTTWASGRRQPDSRHGRLRARFHDRLRFEEGGLHRGVLQEHRLEGG